MKERKIKIGVPKGSLQEHSLRIFRSAGFDIQVLPKRYILKIDDPQIEGYLLRPQEIPSYVEEGKLDAGISGEDWVKETGAKVVEVCDLKYAKQRIKKVKWVLAVSENSNIKKVGDLQGKIVATEVVQIAKDYLKRKKVNAKVVFSWGATEVKPPRFADAIIDLVETGTALKAHNLKVLDTVFESSTKLLANKKSWSDPFLRSKIDELAILLRGAVESEKTVGIFMHVDDKKIKSVLGVISQRKKPTITKIAGTDLSDIFFIEDEKEAMVLLPELKRAGCAAIVEIPLNKAVI